MSNTNRHSGIPRNRSSTRGNWREGGGTNGNRSSSNTREESNERRNTSWKGTNKRSRATNDHALQNSQSKETRGYQKENKVKKVYQMGFKSIQALLDNDDLEDVTFQLNNDRKGFKELLEDKEMKPDIIVLLVKLVGKICSSSFPSSIIMILETSLRSNFNVNLVNYISKLPIQDTREKRFNSFFWKDPDDFWHNIITLAKTAHNLTPLSLSDVMVKILRAAKTYIPVIEANHSIHISDDIKTKIESLYLITEKAAQEAERKREQPQYVAEEYCKEPPDDFREISVYPRVEELITRQSPFLRANIVDRPYDSIHQYLDIQYRLLREDFVRPLRQGICQYIEDPNKRKLDDIKIYKRIIFLGIENVNEQNCFRIQFDFNKKKKNKINYEQSKRFIFGSLLCFTSDNFGTILFGKVVQRDVKDLENGHLIVGFDEDIIMPPDLFHTDFLMVESSVYFEPYYQVLRVLKTMSTEHFPMERYIIRVMKDLKPPEYLLDIDPQYFTIENETFWPLDWGERKFYSFNESQEKAFKAALTQEFAIIQGPPGTGKTFLGLKIAKTLIENNQAWYAKSPMLIICFTNHALDQFLEGLLDVTHDIVRVGGQSKNERLAPFNIRRKRHFSHPAVIQKRREVRDFLGEIKSVEENLRLIKEGQSLIAFHCFRDIIDLNLSSLSNYEDEELIHWFFSDVDVRQQNQMDYTLMNEAEENDAEDNQSLHEDEVVLDESRVPDKDEIFEEIEIKQVKTVVTVKSLTDKIQSLTTEMLKYNDPHDRNALRNRRKLELQLYNLQRELDYLKYRLGQYQIGMKVPLPNFVDLTKPNLMDANSRWQFYFHCVSNFVDHMKKRKEELTQNFRKFSEFTLN